MVFVGGLLVLVGLVYLFASPLVTSAVHFGHQIPDLIKNARKGRGPLGRLVYRLHLQKYLSEGSAKLTKQLTKVLKPATAFSVGAAALSDLVTIGAIAVLTFFTMLESPRLWNGFLSFFRPSTVAAPGAGRQRVHPIGDRLHAGELPDLADRRRGHAG